MNIYLHVDQAWSYQFLNQHKKIIASYDFFSFSDRFYTTALNFAMAHINFRFNQDSVEYHRATEMVNRLATDYPLLGRYIPQAMYSFYNRHIDAFLSLQGPVINYQTFIDDAQVLTGILFQVDIRSHLKPILQQ